MNEKIDVKMIVIEWNVQLQKDPGNKLSAARANRNFISYYYFVPSENIWRKDTEIEKGIKLTNQI